MFDNLTTKLDSAFKVLKGHGKITEINVAETLKEVRRALIDADVNFKIAKEFVDIVKDKAIGQNVLTSLKPSQLLIKIVKDELTSLMGGESVGINTASSPSIILMSGLQGSGKTTFSGKLAKYLKTQKKKKPLLVACDVYRPAAIEQLNILAEQIEVGIYKNTEEKNPIKIATEGIKVAKKEGYDTVIIDTAGRLAIDSEMMDEIATIHKEVKPNETLFVVDAMTGQDAVNTAKTFHEVLNFDGIILTKIDGDTRGGAALSIKKVVNKPIKFVGNGEKIENIDVFHPDRMADRILGMGDVVSFVEKAQAQFDDEQSRKLAKKIAKNTFDLNDFLSQMQKVKKMGSAKNLVGMIPGAKKLTQNADINENAFIETEVIIGSMTPKERENPKILDLKRKQRIAKGSGHSIEKVNLLVKQFFQMSKMMKTVQKGGKSALMNMMNNFN